MIFIILGIKRRITCQKNVCQNTNRPDISFSIVSNLSISLTFNNLGCNIIWSSYQTSNRFSLLHLESTSKINKLNLSEVSSFFKQNIFGLNISMHHILRMAMSKTCQELFDNFRTIFLFQCALITDQIKQFTSSGHLHDNIILLIVFKAFVHSEDIGVI